MNLKITKILFRFKIPRFKIFKPKYKKILVLDYLTFYKNIFLKRKFYNVLFVRYEEFYIKILFKSLFLFFKKKKEI